MDEGRHLGHRLREARVAAGLSQSKLENISGIPKARLSRYENGRVEPSIQTLARLARALDVSAGSLLGDKRTVLDSFFQILDARGVRVTSKEQSVTLAFAVADMVEAMGGIATMTESNSQSQTVSPPWEAEQMPSVESLI